MQAPMMKTRKLSPSMTTAEFLLNYKVGSNNISNNAPLN
jgi:hypothetical protein